MQGQEAFSDQDHEENRQRKDRLVALLKSRDAILMAGAGCSGGLYPAWDAFIAKMDQAAKLQNPDFDEDPNHFLAFADKVKNCIGTDRYYHLIHETFKPGEPAYQPFHVTLCNLPFKAITTTNYDMVLEYALTSITKIPNNSLHFEGSTKDKINEFLLSLNHSSKNISRRVVHLHGIYDQTDTIILSESEYQSKYGFSLVSNDDTIYEKIAAGAITKEQFQELLVQYGYHWPIRRKLIWSLLATRRIVFVGFSMRDPYFNKMLDFIQNDLGTYNSETHFLILRVLAKDIPRSKAFAEKLKQDYGIDTVFFEEQDGVYSGLSNFINEIADDVLELAIPPAKAQPEEEQQIADEGSEEITNYLLELGEKQIDDEY